MYSPEAPSPASHPTAFERHQANLSPILPEDTPNVAALFAHARMAQDEILIPGYIQNAVQENYFEKAVGKFFNGAYGLSLAYKATRGPSLVGFCMSGQADSYPEISDFMSGPSCGELHWLYVEPTLKRRGIGSLLFRQAMQTLCRSGYRRAVINMLQNKPETLAFYRTMGAEILAERIEHNTRNGLTFRVPCLLLGLELNRFNPQQG